MSQEETKLEPKYLKNINKNLGGHKMTNTKTQLQIIDTREVLGMDFKIYGDIETTLFIAKDVAVNVNIFLYKKWKIIMYNN